MIFVKNKGSISAYVSAVRIFVTTQIQYCDLLQSYSDEWGEKNGKEDQNEVVRNANFYLRVLQTFCRQANENLNLVKSDDSVKKIRVCTLFNENVISNAKFRIAVPILICENKSLNISISTIEHKLIDLVMRSLAMLRKNLARINQIMVDANQFEAHESMLALIKLNRLLDAPVQQKETTSYAVVANAFEVPVDPIHDTSLVCQKINRSGDEGRSTFVAFRATRRKISSLQAAVGKFQQAMEHIVGENLRFAEMWYELLGRNTYEYAVRSFLDQCRVQRQSSQEISLRLTEMQNVLQNCQTSLDRVMKIAGVGAGVMKELKTGGDCGENYRNRMLQVVSSGHSQALKLMATVIRALIGTMHQWLGSFPRGRKPQAGNRDIVADYHKCMMFTDALCKSEKRKVKMFESPAASSREN